MLVHYLRGDETAAAQHDDPEEEEEEQQQQQHMGAGGQQVEPAEAEQRPAQLFQSQVRMQAHDVSWRFMSAACLVLVC